METGNWKTAGLLVFHAAVSVALLHLWSSPPTMQVEMSSTVTSRAQVYWDMGAGMSEDQSSSQLVRPDGKPHLLTFALPHGQLNALRFDPLTSPGTIVVRRAALVQSDGSELPIDLHLIRGLTGFDQMEFGPGGLRYRIRTDSLDPQLAIDLKYPIDLGSNYPGNAVIVRIIFWNTLLFVFEYLLLFWKPGFSRVSAFVSALDSSADVLAERLSDPRFIVFDRFAIWFYGICVALFIVGSLADLNGSSIGVFWTHYKAGAPANLIAGTPQPIRADEIYYATPYILNQYFRSKPFEMTETASGTDNVGLLAGMPVKHVTTWARPQFWPFFFMPAEYAFATWWQAKGLIMVTGVFTLLLLMTHSSMLSIIGTLWLVFSQFTQWCYSWPSMLPEMAGMFCFSVVFFLYLTVGRNRWALAFSAIAGAACAVNFALCAYVPHQIPYAWTGIIVAAAWLIAHRSDIRTPDRRVWRIAAALAFLALTGALMLTVLGDTKTAVAGIAGTVYPGHRNLNGGGLWLTTMATHFLAATEGATRYPPEYSNINEATGFLWLAPVTLLAFFGLRSWKPEQRILFIGLWITAILFTAWMALPIPASIGSWFFFNRAQGVRFLPALGLVNTFIVMLFLNAPVVRGRHALGTKLILTTPVVFVLLFLANRNVHSYFHLSELLLGTVWASLAVAFLLEGRRWAFAAAVVVPNVILFGLINPVQRGIDPITKSTLFEVVQQNPRLRHGKWMIFGKGFPPSIFTAVGCDVYNSMRYLPDLRQFPLLADHGVDTEPFNNLGYVDVVQLERGQRPRAALGKYGPILSVDPLDPLLKELGIRYVAFHEHPPADMLKHLKPLIDGTVSEFWIYELE
jgi:hypothetical protein